MKTLNDANSRPHKPAIIILVVVIITLTMILLVAHLIEQSQSAPEADSPTADNPITMVGQSVETQPAITSGAASSQTTRPPAPQSQAQPSKDGRLQLLHDVHVTTNAAGAYEIEGLTIDTVFDRLGLRPGDVVYSLDQLVDLQTQQAAHNFRQPDVKLDVYRDDQPVVLQAHLED
jgi:hypothetical protein